MSQAIKQQVSLPEGKGTLDKIGAGVSFACAIHCLLTPLLAGLLPVSALAFSAHRGFEDIFIAVSFCLACCSLGIGYRTHRKSSLFLLLVLSIALMIASRSFVESVHETVLLVIGALGITICHILNRRLCKTCPACKSDCCG